MHAELTQIFANRQTNRVNKRTETYCFII